MKKERYSFIKRSDNNYEFISEGPNGNIIKSVEFSRLPMPEIEIFFLGFGDWDEKDSQFNDMSVSNNSDTEKILTTVAWALIDFMQHHADFYPEILIRKVFPFT